MNKAKRSEYRLKINWRVLLERTLLVGFIIFVVVGLSAMIWLNVDMKANAPCEDFASWVEPPARCWEYFGGRDR